MKHKYSTVQYSKSTCMCVEISIYTQCVFSCVDSEMKLCVKVMLIKSSSVFWFKNPHHLWGKVPCTLARLVFVLMWCLRPHVDTCCGARAVVLMSLCVCSSNLRTGDRVSPTTSSRWARTVWWWSGMKTASGTMCRVTTVCLSPARRAQVSRPPVKGAVKVNVKGF